MKSYIQPGCVLTFPAPYDVVSGAGALIGSFFGVAAKTYLSGAVGEFKLDGVYELAKTSAQAWVIGDPIFWDNTNKVLDNRASVGPMVGVATAVAANPTATGVVRLDGVAVDRAGFVEQATPAPVSYATAGNRTVLASDVIAGIYVRDCAGAGRTDTLPTAALLVAAIPGAKIGDVIELYVVNGSDAAETLTVAAGTGGAFDVNQTAASQVVIQNTSKTLKLRLTNVTLTTEAYVAYL